MSANLAAALAERTPSIREALIDDAIDEFLAKADALGLAVSVVAVLTSYGPRMTRDEMGELAFRLVRARGDLLDILPRMGQS